jgi:predicted N-acyltransferase
VPFTPATGNRFLVKPGTSDAQRNILVQTLASTMRTLARENKLSGANVNFMPADEVELLKPVGYMHRQTIQYRWHNRYPDSERMGEKYADFEAYLEQFKSKRRMQIRRERRSVYEDQGVRVDVIRGDDDRATTEMYEDVHRIYASTVDKMWGQQYLSKEFFQMLSKAPKEFRKHVLFVLAYDTRNDDALVGGTFNLVSDSHYYGRYWGCFEYKKNLHFECCYYKVSKCVALLSRVRQAFVSTSCVM